MKKYKMDLHVHTPASSCYLDERDDETYIKILRKAVNDGISILGVTDHNTISGYDYFFVLKGKYEAEKTALQPYSANSPEIQKRIADLDSIIDLYTKVMIIPGVEITLNPGVHMIVLADVDQKGHLLDILDIVGYDENARGSDSDFVPNMDVKAILNIPLLKDKIVFAPHVDSSKGIYNEIKGLFRAEIFRSSVINAISVNSVTQLNKIQELIKNDPNYRREKIWAYINASDAHKVEDVGCKVSYVALEALTFENLILAINNSVEFISDVENQDISVLIEILNKRQKVINIQDIDSEKFETLLCAALNTGYQGIIIGVDTKLQILGSSIEKDEMSMIMNSAQESLENADQLDCGLIIETLGNGRNVYVVLIRNNLSKICYVKASDEVYIYDKQIRKARIAEVERIISDKLLHELEVFQRKNDVAISEIYDKLKIIEHPIEKYKLVKSIEREKRYLYEIADITPLAGESKNIIDLGKSVGNCYFAKNENIVLDYAVLRFSCPIDEVELPEEQINQFVKAEKIGIIITEKGGSYLVEKNCEMIIDSDAQYLILNLQDDSEFSIYALLAWLKSSAFFWYMTKISEDTKLYYPSVFKKIIVPNLKCLFKGEKIEELSKEVIVMEKEFLVKMDELREFPEDVTEEEKDTILDEINRLTTEHNEKIGGIISQIDDIIFNAMKLSDHQRTIIYDDLDAAGLLPSEEEQ